MPVRIWSNRNSFVAAMNTNGKATLNDSWAVSYKTKYSLTVQLNT